MGHQDGICLLLSCINLAGPAAAPSLCAPHSMKFVGRCTRQWQVLFEWTCDTVLRSVLQRSQRGGALGCEQQDGWPSDEVLSSSPNDTTMVLAIVLRWVAGQNSVDRLQISDHLIMEAPRRRLTHHGDAVHAQIQLQKRGAEHDAVMVITQQAILA